MTDLLENLNERQQEAVWETEGYVRVIAGAGSGKTKLLVSRYAYLVQEYGIDSGNILCVTFTNKAAGEMKKRIRRLIGDGNDLSLICTYHGFCNRLLREDPEKLFLSKQFQIIDSRQQKHILDDIYQKHELKLNYATFESMLSKIGKAKRDLGYVKRICCPGPSQILSEIKNQDDELLEEFLQRQKATHSLDFHDLIAFALYLLETCPDIREKWQRRLNYIMVDEFQDSSATEMQLVDILSGMYQNLMIVGDPDQNIYEWRGSDGKLLVDFDKEHEPTKTIILDQNYRSTPQILRCANTLIEKNKMRLEKNLFTLSPDGAPVVHYHAKDEFEEMDQVIENIVQLREKDGLRYSDFAILYRAGFLSRITEKKLVEKNIPYEIFGGVRFYQRMEILDLLAYLKLIAYDDNDSFLRVVNTPARRFGRRKLHFVEEMRQQELGIDGSLFATLVKYMEDKNLSDSDVGAFVRLIEDMRGRYRTMRISEIVNTVAEASGYEKYMRELGDEERLSNLVEFKRIANEFEREFGENLSLEEFLGQIALQSGEDRSEPRDTIKLMTIHASKGLEFPAVFILGFTEGVFPSAKTIGDRKNPGLEEERRLCYVAITRAEKYLFLMESEGMAQNGSKKMVSRFLEEIGESNYVRIGCISEDLQRESKKYAAKLDWEMQLEAAGSRKVGDIVEHHIFGSGVIEAIDVKRGSYSIQFEKFRHPRDISSSYFTQKHEGIHPYPDRPANSAQPEIAEKKEDTENPAESKEIEVIREEERSPNAAREESAHPENVEKHTKTEVREQAARLKALKENSPNLWKCSSVPHSGWTCVGVEDLGSPAGICQMCGYQIIRYAHQMEHPDYSSLSVGCVCAGRMEGDAEQAKRREADFKNCQTRRMNFCKREWKRSRKGNEYLKIENHVVVLYHDTIGQGSWKYSIDNEFSRAVYISREQAVTGVFEALERMRSEK